MIHGGFKQLKGVTMSAELNDFKYFRDNQLHTVNFNTGEISAKGGRWGTHIYQDIGSSNPDGYVRLWCNRKLRMKHRLIYFLYHNDLPTKGEEIDHFDHIRDNNAISNLRILSKAMNNTGCLNKWSGPRFAKEIIVNICELLQNTNTSDQNIANITGVSRSLVRDIKTYDLHKSISQNYSWKHRGY